MNLMHFLTELKLLKKCCSSSFCQKCRGDKVAFLLFCVLSPRF